MTQPRRSGRTPEQWVGLIASVVAPTTLITALLYYFGYVSTLATYAYFGVDVDALGYSSADFVLRSAAALFVPLLVLVLLAIGGYVGHRLIRRMLARWQVSRPTALRRLGWGLIVAGLLVFGRGVAGVVDVELARREPAAFTPTCLAVGVILVGYGCWMLRFGPRNGRTRIRLTRFNRSERVVAALLSLVVVFTLFWVTNTVAAAYGRGTAQRIAENPQTRPGVVLDTTERLYIPVGSASEVRLPDDTDQTFRYRYTGLRLLVVGETGWLLLSENWNRQSGFVLVVPADGTSRVRVSPG